MAKKQAQKELLQNTIQHENSHNFTIIKIKTFFKNKDLISKPKFFQISNYC